MAGAHIGAEFGAQQVVALGAVVFDLGYPAAVRSGRLLRENGRGHRCKHKRTKHGAPWTGPCRRHLAAPGLQSFRDCHIKNSPLICQAILPILSSVVEMLDNFCSLSVPTARACLSFPTALSASRFWSLAFV
jgi:hypothetical protein